MTFVYEVEVLFLKKWELNRYISWMVLKWMNYRKTWTL